MDHMFTRPSFEQRLILFRLAFQSDRAQVSALARQGIEL